MNWVSWPSSLTLSTGRVATRQVHGRCLDGLDGARRERFPRKMRVSSRGPDDRVAREWPRAGRVNNAIPPSPPPPSGRKRDRVAWAHDQDDAAPLPAGVDIGVGFGGILDRVDAVDHRLQGAEFPPVKAMTSSPGPNFVTLLPTASTIPPIRYPRIGCRGGGRAGEACSCSPIRCRAAVLDQALRFPCNTLGHRYHFCHIWPS